MFRENEVKKGEGSGLVWLPSDEEVNGLIPVESEVLRKFELSAKRWYQDFGHTLAHRMQPTQADTHLSRQTSAVVRSAIFVNRQVTGGFNTLPDEWAEVFLIETILGRRIYKLDT
jgi:hypothetical protein